MIDWNYLRSPEGKAEAERSRKEREEEQSRKESAWNGMLEHCVEHIHKYSSWEREFIRSLSSKIEHFGLSAKQEEILKKLYKKY